MLSLIHGEGAMEEPYCLALGRRMQCHLKVASSEREYGGETDSGNLQNGRLDKGKRSRFTGYESCLAPITDRISAAKSLLAFRN